MKNKDANKKENYELREDYDLSKMIVLPKGRFAAKRVQIKNVRVEGNTLYILLSDGREISLPIDQMDWLKWTIEPGGCAVYWEELDDGFEIEHLLSLQPLA